MELPNYGITAGKLLHTYRFEKEPLGKWDSHHVISASFLPDGQHILTVSEGDRIRFYDLQGNLFRDIYAKDSGLDDIVLSPDGTKMLATYSFDPSAALFDLSPRLIQSFFGPGLNQRKSIISPDGEIMLTIERNKKSAIWNRAGKVLGTFHIEGWLDDVYLSSDMTRLLTEQFNDVKLWKIAGIPYYTSGI